MSPGEISRSKPAWRLHGQATGRANKSTRIDVFECPAYSCAGRAHNRQVIPDLALARGPDSTLHRAKGGSVSSIGGDSVQDNLTLFTEEL